MNPINLINNAKIDGPLFRVFGTAAEVSDEGTLLFNSPGENIATAADASRTFPDLAQVAADNTNAATGACPAFTVTPDLRSDAIAPDAARVLLGVPADGRLRARGAELPAHRA